MTLYLISRKLELAVIFQEKTATSAALLAKVTTAVKIYPNPAKEDYLTVEVFATEKQAASLILINANAQNVVNYRNTLQVGANKI